MKKEKIGDSETYTTRRYTMSVIYNTIKYNKIDKNNKNI